MADNPQDDDSVNDSYAEEGYGESDQEAHDSMQALGSGPSVAAPPGKVMMIAAVAILLFGFVIYQLFFTEEDVAPPPPSQPPQAAPVAEADIPVSQIPIEPPPPPQLPPLPVDDLPPIPNLPPPPEPQFDLAGQGPTNEQLAARRKSAMIIGGGGTAAPLIDAGDSNTLGIAPSKLDYSSENDPFKSSAQRAVATHVGELNKLILQGKIIHAVLETAIDTTFPGPLRALVSRDVYAESGKDVLVPKGTRLIGNYNADVVRGQARIFIIWNRLIRPDGVDLDISSPAVDRLGRTGLEGYVDNRYFEIFTGVALTSVFTIGLAATAESIFGEGDVTTSQNTDGSQTQTGSPTSTAIQESVTNMGGTAQRVLGGLIDARPLITVDQGTPVNIFVNKDLEFPDEVTGRIKLIQ